MYKRGSSKLSEREKRKQGGDWWTKVRVGPGRFKQVRLCSDKATSETWERLLQNAADRKLAGEPPDASKMNGIPRRCLESLGLVSKLAAKRRASWCEHVADYVSELVTAGRNAIYSANARRYLTEIGKVCQWATLEGIDRNAFAKFIAKRREEGASARTINNITSFAKSFLTWATNTERIDRNPLLSVGKLDESADRRRRRRALADEECIRLLGIAKRRELCYRVALGTGLRKRELKLLEWRDVLLDDGQPRIQLRPEATKSKRADTLPISSELAQRLRAARPTPAAPMLRVFRNVPGLETFQRDLKSAGILYRDGEGRIVGFHSLRVTFITALHRAGLPTKVVMTLARHTDPKLTLGTYTDLAFFDTHGAANLLPSYLPIQADLDSLDPANGDTVGDRHQNRHQTGDVSSRFEAVEAGSNDGTNEECDGGSFECGDAETLDGGELVAIGAAENVLPGTGIEPALRITGTRPST